MTGIEGVYCLKPREQQTVIFKGPRSYFKALLGLAKVVISSTI